MSLTKPDKEGATVLEADTLLLDDEVAGEKLVDKAEMPIVGKAVKPVVEKAEKPIVKKATKAKAMTRDLADKENGANVNDGTAAPMTRRSARLTTR